MARRGRHGPRPAPAAAERLVEADRGLETVEPHLGQLILGGEERALGVEHGELIVGSRAVADRDERVVSDRTVDSHIKKIRRKIAAVLPDREIVHSVYGVGYKYEW